MTEYSGILLVDKESGVTSHDVVDDVRRLLRMRTIGHGGTLDPLATGLLVCMVGEATKLSQYVMAEEKSYRVGVRLGVRTDTGDVTGKILEEKDTSHLTEDKIRTTTGALTGTLNLEVPKYSAVKVNGKKLYEYARGDEPVDLPKKLMTIRELKILEVQIGPGAHGRVTVDLDCEKGTYVRSWAEELGRRLDVGGTVETLRRTRSGAYTIDDAVSVGDLQKMEHEALVRRIIPLVDVLKAWPGLKVMEREATLVRNGQLPKGIFSQLLHFKMDSGVRLLSPDGGLLALVVKEPGVGLKLARVFAGRG